jgi:hypothetical protein
MRKPKGEVDASKTLYNKAQLDYLKERIALATGEALERWDVWNPEPAEATDEEKVKQIADGVAKLKPLDELRAGRSTVLYTDLSDAFDFIDPRKEEREAWNKARAVEERELLKMERKAKELIYLGDQTSLLSFLTTIEDRHPPL